MAIRAHRKVKRLKVSFNDDVKVITISELYPGERFVENLKSTIRKNKEQSQADWLKSDGSATKFCVDRPAHKLVHIDVSERTVVETEEWGKVVEQSEKAARVRAIQLHFHVHSNLSCALPITQSITDEQPAKSVPAAPTVLSQAEHGRSWLYDTGAHVTCIGWKHLSPQEQKRAYQVEPKGFTTAAGVVWSQLAVQCYVPFLGKRRCYILPDCPPALSANEELDRGNIFIWTKEDGPIMTLADGTVVYLSTSLTCPTVDGYVQADVSKRAETHTVEDYSMPLTCQPCDQPPGLAPPGSTIDAPKPLLAMKPTCCPDRHTWSVRGRQSAKPSTMPPSSHDAKLRRSLCPERLRDGSTPLLVLKEDMPTIGTNHGSAAQHRSKSSKHQTGETRSALQSWLAPDRPFFVEVFSGSGHLAAAVRRQGVDCFEFDLNEKGGRKDLLKKNVLQELKDLITNPNCVGVW